MASRRKRIRAHANPLADTDIIAPAHPDEYNWGALYPKFITPIPEGQTSIVPERRVDFVDVGCGFGGLLHSLSPLYPEKLILGVEIRNRVVEIVERDIKEARDKAVGEVTATDAKFQNINVLRSNIMKYTPNYFLKGQLEKIFFLFPDPHFKKSKFRLRVINPDFVDYYAYVLKEGGILYTITDVLDLHQWMKKHLDEHPLFELIPVEQLQEDPCFHAIHTGTQEGQKVSRNHGDKWPAVYRRVAYKSGLEGKARLDILE